jgi:hypothetical protein
VPMCKTKSLESESETISSPMHPRHINNIVKLVIWPDRNFCVCQDDTDGSFKIRRSRFKCNNKNVFVDGKTTRERKFCGNY